MRHIPRPRSIINLTLFFLVVSCGLPPQPEHVLDPTPTGILQSSTSTLETILSSADREALESLKKIDPFPLYVMNYAPDKTTFSPSTPYRYLRTDTLKKNSIQNNAWACSLFAYFANPETRLFGRNFDWHYSPALLIFYHPVDGYSSVSMVDLEHIIDSEIAGQLDELSIIDRSALLDAVHIPFDGMNDRGLVVGMAAVPYTPIPYSPDQETLGSLGVMRRILDQASSVEEALEILSNVNLDWGSGPPLHYMISDIRGRSVLVEFDDEEMVVLENQDSWQGATNFLQTRAGERLEGHCRRYDRIDQELDARTKPLTAEMAMDLLGAVSQTWSMDSGTQWSIVYDYLQGNVLVVMGQDYDNPHRIPFNLQESVFK